MVRNGRTYIRAATTPTSAEDFDAGYYIGDRWVVTSTATTYTLTDDTAGAAVWTQEDGSGGGGGGGGTDHATLTHLSWTTSAHTGTANRLAGFSGAGAATYYQIGADVQAYDAGLASLVTVDTAADLVPYTTAANTWSAFSTTATGRAWVGLASAAAMRSALSLVVGVDVQAYDADLDGLAALSTTGLVARTGAGTYTTRTLTAPAAGITVSNGGGVAGNPTLALADDLAALEGLAGTGYAQRTGASTWTTVAATAILDDVLTTKGDLLSFDTAPVRVAVGTNDYSILADSTQAVGWRWFQRRLVSVITTTGTYQTVNLPTDCTYVTIRTVNGGARGGAGTSGTTAAARRGGGGGGGGAEHEITYLRSQLPDTIYAFVAPASSASDGYLSWVAITDTGISTDPAVAPVASYVLAGGGGRASAGTSAGAAGSGGTDTTYDTSSPWCRSCVSQRTVAGGAGQASSTTSTTTNRDPWAAAAGSGITQGGCAGGTNSAGAVAGATGAGWDADGPFAAVAGGTAGTGANAGPGTDGTYGGGAATATTASSDPGELSWAYGGTGGGSAVTGTGGVGGNGAPGCGGGGGGAGTVSGGLGGNGGAGYIIIQCW